MPVTGQLLPGVRQLPTAFEVANSLRFNDGSSDYLSRSISSTSNRRTYTISTWFKRGSMGANQKVITAGTAGQEAGLQFYDGSTENTLRFYEYTGSDVIVLAPNRLLTDPSAWYHVVIGVDTTQSTESNRVKYYLNGVQETSFATATYPSLNYDTKFNTSGQTNYIGFLGSHSAYFDGYMAETILVDGQQLDPTSFGEFDEDSPTIWKPKDVSDLTFGTNGFYLDYEDSSALGNDAAGSNNFTVNNLTAIDQSTDTCTNNFAVLQPNLGPRYSTQTFSNGNLSVSGGAGFEFHPSTIGMTTGKYYFEAKITTLTNFPSVGIIASHQFETNNQDAQSNTQGYVMHFNGQFNNNGVVDYTGTAMSQGDIIMIAFDSGNGVIWFGLNGTWQRSATQSEIEAGTTTNAIFTNITNAGSDSYHFLVQNYGSAWDANFGGTQTYTISSGNTDGNGFGNFEYSVPSGYFSLCSSNLAEFG